MDYLESLLNSKARRTQALDLLYFLILNLSWDSTYFEIYDLLQSFHTVMQIILKCDSKGALYGYFEAI